MVEKKYSSRVERTKQTKSEHISRTQALPNQDYRPLDPRVLGKSSSSTKSKKSNSKATTTKKTANKPAKKISKSKNKQTSSVRKWIGRCFLALLSLGLIGFLLAVVGFFIAYNRIDIPSPNKFAQAQVSTVYWGDGKGVIGKYAERNRINVDGNKLPKYIGYAVVSSEDRTFFENNGVDLKGILRAVINNLQGKPIQGASTLTQQYAENYYTGQDHSYAGKIKETILALKINKQQSKNQILNNYLNTIYLGRGSYGIEAASEAYFGKHAKELTLSEAAMLAGIIPAPSNWDPAINPEITKKRWNRVLNIMVEDGWISKSEREKQKFPKVKKFEPNKNYYQGPNGYILEQVKTELQNKVGYSKDDIERLGLTIITTLDEKKQNYLYDAVQKLPSDHAPGLRVAAVSLDNATGGIVAEYAGKDYLKIQSNAATQDIAQGGSTYKAFAMLAGIIQGVKVTDTANGNSPIQVNGKRVENFGNYSYGNITYTRALEFSVNTAFIRLTEKIGFDAVRNVAIAAGIPADTVGLNKNSVLGVLGTSTPHTLDLTQAYSTFANLGIRRDAHIIAKVMDAQGNVLYEPNTTGTRQFRESDVRQLNTALQSVVTRGTLNRMKALNRPVAGKTGTSEYSKSAQAIAYTKRYTTGVSMYQVGKHGEEEPITPFGGIQIIDGGNWPAQVWTWYMSKALAGESVLPIPDSTNIPKGHNQEVSGPKYRVPNYNKASDDSKREIKEEEQPISPIPSEDDKDKDDDFQRPDSE